MRTYAWGDPDDFDTPHVETQLRGKRTDDNVEQFAAFIGRHELGSLNLPASALVSGR